MRALLSVWDKTGLVALAEGLTAQGVELIASGGTATALADAGIAHTTVEATTGAAEMPGGRVKTLHPRIHGGILAQRGDPDHQRWLDEQGIGLIDVVVCNLYPFTSDPSIELIDVGGPTMVRAAAKNHDHVAVIVDPADYGAVLDELRLEGSVSAATRRALARKAFAHTAAYDAAIVTWFDEADGELMPPTIHIALERAQELRYGENPHQPGARYRSVGSHSWWDDVVQHSGLELSYLNLYDAEAAWKLVHDLGDVPAAVIIKHANPCGVAVRDDPVEAYRLAYECDEQSAFGGIVAFNRPVTIELAEAMAENRGPDVVIASVYADDAVERLIKRRKATRILQAPAPDAEVRDLRQIGGGFLVQKPHHFGTTRDDWRVVTKVAPTEEQWRDAELAWRVGGHVKSNSIVLVGDGVAWGIGAGQQKRVDSGEIAARKAAGRAVGGACASDAFYPFPDGVEAAIAAGAAVVIQPGGGLRDDDIIKVADDAGIAMIFTSERHFLH